MAQNNLDSSVDITDLNYLDELKALIKLHLASQGENPNDYRNLLASIENDTGGDQNSWCNQWIKKGNSFKQSGNRRKAILCYNFARFPFIDGTHRKNAHALCLKEFEDLFITAGGRVKKVNVSHCGHTIPVYTSGKWTKEKPLLVVMGGIVSIKEQWGDILLNGDKLGFSVCVAEFPSVGDNPMVYDKNSYLYLGSILDCLQTEPGTTAYFVGISFSGELVLKFAAEDKRVQGALISGTPIQEFFLNYKWHQSVPETTKRTLMHLTQSNAASLFSHMNEYHISDQTLKKINIPLKYIACVKDEIVPFEEAKFMFKCSAKVAILELNDVHGGPNCMPLIKKFIPLSLLEFRGKKNHPLYWVLSVLVTFLSQKFKAKIR